MGKKNYQQSKYVLVDVSFGIELQLPYVWWETDCDFGSEYHKVKTMYKYFKLLSWEMSIFGALIYLMTVVESTSAHLKSEVLLSDLEVYSYRAQCYLPF